MPGNPWVICTLWQAMYHIEAADTVEELRLALPLLEWCVRRALPSGVMAEQFDPYTGAPISVSPLTWSHATYVAVCIQYLRRLESIRDKARSRTGNASQQSAI